MARLAACRDPGPDAALHALDFCEARVDQHLRRQGGACAGAAADDDGFAERPSHSSRPRTRRPHHLLGEGSRCQAPHPRRPPARCSSLCSRSARFRATSHTAPCGRKGNMRRRGSQPQPAGGGARQLEEAGEGCGPPSSCGATVPRRVHTPPCARPFVWLLGCWEGLLLRNARHGGGPGNATAHGAAHHCATGCVRHRRPLSR